MNIHRTPSVQSGDNSAQKFNQTPSSQPGTEEKRSRPLSQSTFKYESIRKSSKNIDMNSSSDMDSNEKWQVDKIQNLEQQVGLQVIDEQQSVVSSQMPVRQKYSHLLPNYMGANYSFEQRKLLCIQAKMDQLLQYLRLNRQKNKGEFLSILRNSLSQFAFRFQHLKQIVYIKQDLYNCSLRQNQNRPDISIALPIQTDLKERKDQFRRALYKYIMENKNEKKFQQVRIPQYTFNFETKEDTKQKFLDLMKNTTNPLSQLNRDNSVKSKSSKINPFDAFRLGPLKFQQQLLASVKQRQIKLKAQKQKIDSLEYSEKEMLKVLDEIPRIFKIRDKTSMFRITILLDLDKHLEFSKEFLDKVITDLTDKHPEFLKKIEHQGGQILQIQRKYYSDIRKQLDKKINRSSISLPLASSLIQQQNQQLTPNNQKLKQQLVEQNDHENKTNINKQLKKTKQKSEQFSSKKLKNSFKETIKKTETMILKQTSQGKPVKYFRTKKKV